MIVTSQFSIASSGVTKTFPLNHRRGPDFKVSVGLNLTAGTTPTIQVQITFDDLEDSSITPVFHNTGSALSAAGTAIVDITSPCTGILVNTSAGTSVVGNFSIVQAG